MRRYKFLFFSLLFISSFAKAQEAISLEHVIGLALEHNYNVRLAKNVSKEASIDKHFTYGAFVPRINAVGTTVWNNSDQELRFQDETRNNTGKAESHNITGSLQLVWTLFDGTRMFATRERLDVIAAQDELLVKDQMVNTIASVILNYYDVVRQKQQLKAIQEQMSVSEERVKLADRKLQVGTGSKPELLQARVDYNAQRTQALQQEALIIQLKDQLNGLVGLQLPNRYEVADSILINLDLKQEQIESTIENSNYQLQAARKNLHTANLSLRERKAEYAPTLDFNAAYNYSRLENTRLINPFGPVFNQTDGYNYGFTLNIPILNGFNQRRLVQQARVNIDRQQLLYDQQKIDVNINVSNAFVNYDNAKKVLLIEEENILLAKENVNIALEVFKRGASTFVELRTAQQSLADAYTRLINARFAAKVAEVELLRLNGSLIK